MKIWLPYQSHHFLSLHVAIKQTTEVSCYFRLITAHLFKIHQDEPVLQKLFHICRDLKMSSQVQVSSFIS